MNFREEIKQNSKDFIFFCLNSNKKRREIFLSKAGVEFNIFRILKNRLKMIKVGQVSFYRILRKCFHPLSRLFPCICFFFSRFQVPNSANYLIKHRRSKISFSWRELLSASLSLQIYFSCTLMAKLLTIKVFFWQMKIWFCRRKNREGRRVQCLCKYVRLPHWTQENMATNKSRALAMFLMFAATIDV